MVEATKTEIIDMFLDRTAGEATTHNRLTTRETDGGNVILVAYGWLKLAEYDEQRGIVTIFGGHRAIGSKTVNRYLNDVLRVVSDRSREVVMSGESPTVDTPNEGARFIGNYVSMDGSHSGVEQDAVETVIDSLA
jgi:hypothetical protein